MSENYRRLDNLEVPGLKIPGLEIPGLEMPILEMPILEMTPRPDEGYGVALTSLKGIESIAKIKLSPEEMATAEKLSEEYIETSDYRKKSLLTVIGDASSDPKELTAESVANVLTAIHRVESYIKSNIEALEMIKGAPGSVFEQVSNFRSDNSDIATNPKPEG